MAIRTKQQRIVQKEYPEFAKRIEENLTQLEAVCRSWTSKSHSFSQGFTYFGQFLAHDTSPREGVNQRSWKLDLDSLYPGFSDQEKIETATGKFKTTPATGMKLQDLLRDNRGKKALIPDFRNDDHFIIAQLHLTLQLFHNSIVDIVFANSPAGYRADSAFVSAKEYLRACVHRIAMDEYLEQLCDEKVYAALWTQAQPSILHISEDERGQPFDVSHGAGRFGHSLVRENYVLNLGSAGSAKSIASLADLFELSHGHNPAYDGVPGEFRIDWNLFFPNPHSPNGLAESIDPAVAEALLVAPSPNMIEKILLAGVGKKLPPGQVIADAIIKELNLQHIDDEHRDSPLGVSRELRVQIDNAEQKRVLENLGFWDETPLWLFVLIEADGTPRNGLKLGPLGSILILESYKNSIRIPGVSSYSFVQAQFEHAYPNAKPVRKMYDLISQIPEE